MNKETFDVGPRHCTVIRQEDAKVLLLQPVDDHDLEFLEHEAQVLSSMANEAFMLAAFQVDDWNKDLSPWEAPAVFGRQDFGNGAQESLRFVLEEMLPALLQRYSMGNETPVILGGYSLAAFFSLWSVYQTDRFLAAACASPSVWFPGWTGYAKAHRPMAECIYLSLGKKEEKTKNKVMASVGNCIRTQQAVLEEQNKEHVLEWNEGNHFTEPDIRCAKGFAWCMDAIRRLDA
ncbi:MAG: esterase [Parasporobacterium sp.]|nr:esterase [Parasporobacterium sp.]